MTERGQRLALHACIWAPLAGGIAWCAAGQFVPGVLGIATCAVNAHLLRHRLRLRLPTFGDPNRRRPLVIKQVRWPGGR